MQLPPSNYHLISQEVNITRKCHPHAAPWSLSWNHECRNFILGLHSHSCGFGINELGSFYWIYSSSVSVTHCFQWVVSLCLSSLPLALPSLLSALSPLSPLSPLSLISISVSLSILFLPPLIFLSVSPSPPPLFFSLSLSPPSLIFLSVPQPPTPTYTPPLSHTHPLSNTPMHSLCLLVSQLN